MKYISLLRGINVSGQKKINMDDLKSLYEKVGLQDVVTYIQSGNVIFSSDNKNKPDLCALPDLCTLIEKAIEKKYKFHVPVEIRTHRELSNIIKNCPFGSVDIEQEGTKVLVTFLSSKPLKGKLGKALEYAATSEKLVLEGKEVYLYCPNGYGKSKLSNTFLEKTLGVGATTRNWKSVNQLYELSMS